jgi:hypothetical protein
METVPEIASGGGAASHISSAWGGGLDPPDGQMVRNSYAIPMTGSVRRELGIALQT